MQKSELITPDTIWSILEDLQEGVIIIDQNGAVVYSNQSAKAFFRPLEPITFSKIAHIFSPSLSLASLLDGPYEETAIVVDTILTCQFKPVQINDKAHVQLTLLPVQPAKSDRKIVHQLATLMKLDHETSFEKKMFAVVDGVKNLGWKQVELTLRNDAFYPQRLIGTVDTATSMRFPNTFWLELFSNRALHQFNYRNCYFIPAETEWLQRHQHALDIATAYLPGRQADEWHPNDLFCVPLVGREQRRFGLLYLAQPLNGKRPTRDEMQSIEIYARFSASLLENSLLFEEAAARNRELEILFNTSQALSSTLDRQEVLTILGQYMLQSVEADGYTIYRWSKRQQKLIVLQEFAASAIGQDKTRTDTAVPLNDNSPIRELLNQQYANVHDLKKFAALPHPTWIAQPDNYSCAVLPLVRSEETYGLIQIFKRKNGRSFDHRDLQLLSAIGNQASTALETALIFEDTYEREQFYNSLGNVNLAMNFSLDKERVLQLICEEAIRIFNVDGAYIWQIEDGWLIGTAADGYAAERFFQKATQRLKTGTFTQRLLDRSESLFINDVPSDDVNIALPDSEKIQAILGVPLEQNGIAIGLLVLTDLKNPHRFTNRDASWASLYGIQVSIALQNANLFAELKDFNEQLDMRVAERTRELNQQNERVEILLRITSELSRSLDQDRVISKALALVNDVVDATQSLIMLIDQATGELVFRAALGGDTTSPYYQGAPSGLMKDQGLAGWIIDNRSAVIVHDTRDDPRWVTLPSSPDHRSVLGIPLISNEDVIGVMMLFHEETHAFTAEQFDLVEAATIQVANAINNASLYRLISEQAERLGSALRNEIIQKANLEAVLESMADGVLVADEQNNIDMVNQSACLILGVDREQLNGRSINGLLGLYGNFQKSWLKTIEQWSKNSDRIPAGTFLTDQLHIEDKSISVKLSPVISEKLFYGTVSIFRDITKEVEVERLKNEFVSTVSHELRTPMTSIKGYADLLLMGAAGEMTDPQLQYLQVIKNNAERLHLLVNDLLDISRIETGKTELDLRPLNITQLIDQVVNNHLIGRIHDEGKEIAVERSYENALPLVNADKRRVTQILTNLLDNAFNYTEPPGQIKLRAHSNGQFVYVSVEDNGIGISKENIKMIFDRFYRSDHEKVQRVSGTGLGLSIVQSLVDMHGGQLSVTSEIGQGSTFTFNLPVVVEDGDPSSAVLS